MQELYRRARQIRLAIFDVDGVLTDGALAFGSSGEELKVFNVLDGHGMKLLQESGITLPLLRAAPRARWRNACATWASNWCSRALRTSL